jgi:hypothetical protein
MWFESVIHLAEEVAGSMESGTGSNKDAPVKPLRTVVSVRSAAVWRVVEVTVWARRLNPDIDGDTRGRPAWGTQRSEGQDGSANSFQLLMIVLLIWD